MFFNLFKKPKEIKPHHREELLQIIDAIKSTLTSKTSVIWSGFESVESLIEELDEFSEAIKNGELEALKTLSIHFAPTSSFQELSIENGWSDDYLKLGEQFDSICDNYKLYP